MTTQTLHASCVSVGGAGVLLLGAAGRGKSGLALQLMAHGAALIADDRVILTRTGGDVVATCPPALSGLIEARGIGILQAVPGGAAPLRLVVDLDQVETTRLPPKRSCDLLGLSFDLVFGGAAPHFPAAVMQYLKAGRAE